MELIGVIFKKCDLIEVSATFKKREVILQVPNEKNREWDDFVSVQFSQDKCALLDIVNVGDEVKIQANLRGRKYTTKDQKTGFINSIDVWKLEKIGATTSDNKPAPEAPLPTDLRDEPPF
jgi:hypothetical protein